MDYKLLNEIANDVNRLYNALINGCYFTEDELQLITCINGYRIDVLNDCIYARYGYRNYIQLCEDDSI